MGTDGGHVFVIQGDVFRLDCDAWLLPTDAGGLAGVSEAWKGDGKLALHEWKEAPPGWSEDGTEPCPLVPASAGVEAPPFPLLTNVALGPTGGPSSVADNAVRFVERAASWLDEREQPVPPHRFRRLLALPLVGTGKGGGAKKAGEIAKVLLPALQTAAVSCAVDVVLVTFEASHYAAVQKARHDIGDASAGWSALSQGQRDAAERLAERAAKGQLVLFLGAGVSMSAGLPGWKPLFQELADCLQDEGARTEFAHLDPLDQAEILKEEYGIERLQRRVAEKLETQKRPSLTHSLLACLPVREVVTTNYDKLYELASDPVLGAGELAILGRQHPSERSRWLLKMHGDVDDPSTIVLTRSDYLEYAEARGALMGIVQALLMTRHMLFVGFSKDDPNFHRIAHAVARVLPASAAEKFGASLEVEESQMRQQLWKKRLEMIGLYSGADLREASRRLNIFLDYMASMTPHTAHLLEPSFDSLLKEGERPIIELVRELEAEVRKQGDIDEGLRRRIEQFVRDMGGKVLG